MYIYSLADKLG